MLSISGLAFIGLGIKPPLPELGAILTTVRATFTQHLGYSSFQE